jgi:cytidine deaminase
VSAAPDKRRDTSSVTDAELARRATEALKNAYSPYSNIRVGAALLAADGRVFTGCNVENASFGLTLCAERAAVVKAVSEGAREFTALALATDHDTPLMPCGACRQVLFEFAPRMRVLVTRKDGTRQETILEGLLPDAFGPLDMR